MTETERTEEKKEDRGPRGERGGREKISYARGRISYRTQLGIGQRPEKFMEEPKFQGAAPGSREQIAASRSSCFSPRKHELITARRIPECRPPPFSLGVSHGTFYVRGSGRRRRPSREKAMSRKFRYRFRLLPI